MVKDIVIIGAGGFGREIAWLIERINDKEPTWNILGFIDDNKELGLKNIGGYPVIGSSDEAICYPEAWFVCTVAASRIRRNIIKRIKSLCKIQCATLIDPSVIISNRVEIGEGTIICAGTIITVDINIGRHVLIDNNCTIGHDASLRDFVTAYPNVNISGATNIGECVELGTGVQVIQGRTIGDESIIGAGAVVVKDIPDKCTAVGVPAKPIKFNL